MNRRERKREKHRVQRQERRKDLRVGRERAARERIRLDFIPPEDLRGMAAADWDDFETITFAAVCERAREMFPRDSLLKRYLRGGFARLEMRDAQAVEVACILTLAARTLRCDPPWHMPFVTWRREPGVSFFLLWKRQRLVHDAEHGKVGCWGLELPSPDGARLEVGFTRHSIDRLTERLFLDHPVELRALADAWNLLLIPFNEVERIAAPRTIEMREGELVLRLRFRMLGREEEVGYFPLAVGAERIAVAKTFLEPWMSGPIPAVRYSAEERTGFQERYTQEVAPWVRDSLNDLAILRAGEDRYPVYMEWLKREYADLPSRATAWVHAFRLGEAKFEAERYGEARSALESGLKLLAEELARGKASLRAWFAADRGRRLLAKERYYVAQCYSAASVGALAPDAPAVAPPPEEAARLLAKGLEYLELTLAERPEIITDKSRRDPDVARLLAARGERATGPGGAAGGVT